ncbi:MAG: glycosyltransferase [bacterium]|nr:glycosyltransferase [bacterium]
MDTVPNIIHFCYFGGLEFSLINYLAVRSAYEVNKPDQIYFYTSEDPGGEWYEQAKQYLTVVPTTFPDKIFGVDVPHPAHKADIIRLQKLIELGGIYLDWDIICAKPFTPLRQFRTVLGEEIYDGHKVGLCNAVILARPQENFTKRWLEGFDPNKSLWHGFRSTGPDLYYSEMPVKYPHFLSLFYPEEIHVEPKESFFYPSYFAPELEEFFTTDSHRFDGAYCYHLWNNAAYDKYLKDITPEKIKTEDTAFTRLARPFLP